jgi:protein-S-isoprenylcysteine O-methyltransferase Ste14
MDIKALVGSGDSIMLFTLPFAVLGVVLNLVFPTFFDVGGPSHTLTVVSVALVTFGAAIWAWSVVLILTKVPGRMLITSGPYAVVKHPLYTGVALLVLPWAGFLFNTWIGVLLGIAMYVGSRIYAPREERILSKAFGTSWDEYCERVKIPWL